MLGLWVLLSLTKPHVINVSILTGATVNVLETAVPLSKIYTIVTAPTFSENFTYAITDTIPLSARDLFSVDWSGSINVPLDGFGRHNMERNFKLYIAVTENTVTVCTGVVTIVVTPVRHWPPVFTSVPRTVSIPENQGPEFYVTKVSANGEKVHYHLATFHPSFKIGEADGTKRQRGLSVGSSAAPPRGEGDNYSHPPTDVIIAPHTTIKRIYQHYDWINKRGEVLYSSKNLKNRVTSSLSADSLWGIAVCSRDCDTGIIKTSFNLDLDQDPGLAVNLLVIVAYDDSYLYSSATNVTVYVTDVNNNSPVCTPPIFVTEILETTPVGSTLFELLCSDPDHSNTTLSYTIVPNDNSQFKFKYGDHSVKVNESLDYDSAVLAALDFRYTAVVTVVDGGLPPQTTTVSLLVTVTQVNEFPPIFHGTRVFSVSENSAVNTRVGAVNATDADWVYNDLRFTIVGHDPPTFYIHPFTGEINTLVPLDFERVDTYALTIQAVDMNYDVVFDSFQQRTSYAQYIVNVKNVNDIPPICDPPYYKETIYSTRAANIPITTLSCTDRDSDQLTYRIVGGNINSRFTSRGSTLFSRNAFSYNMDGIYDPTTYELLIQVSDVVDTDSQLQLTTTAIVIVHVIPWITTVATTNTLPTTRTAVHKMVTVLEKYWKPESWFVVLLTVVAALAAVALATLLWSCLARTSWYKRIFPQGEVSQQLLQDSPLPEAAAQKGIGNGDTKNKELVTKSPLSLQFDGRAVDSNTGRHYLFNSMTGTRRWM
ncbi:cadherin-related family member 4 [Amblyraja radiata]|uniref:cadherin-related family member 4 n=1 Tax=Amblyraja radiata TaxID=386614 RepID=UPI001401EF22|nr:cadherin-related family member 4 [Amblyraja radiata]